MGGGSAASATSFARARHLALRHTDAPADPKPGKYIAIDYHFR